MTNFDKGENLRTTLPIFKKLEFTPLPGAEKEAMDIASIIGKEKSTLLVGKDATEEALMSIKSPLFMHIATHGFFLKDQDLSELVEENRGIQLIHLKQETQATYLRPFQYQYPLLRAGLAFAGANVRSEDGSHIDGIVTAEKILKFRTQRYKTRYPFRL